MAQKLAWVFAIVFILVGVLGFIPGVTTESGLLLGIFHVDTIHNIVHILSGVIALLVVKSASAAKMYFKIFGVVYALVTVIGFAMDDVLGLFVVNTADNILHLVIALAALYVGFMGKKEMSAPVMQNPMGGGMQ